MRRLLTWLAVAVAAGGVSADVTWLEREYDFGLMKEAAGVRTGTARFVNNGPESVTVVEARPSCGCTGTTIPDDPVAPGDTAVISFTYDPAGRPGRFEKSIRVRFNDGGREVIKITGNVLGTPESLAQFYPVEAGAFRLSDDKVIAGNVTMGKTPGLFANAYNTLNDSVTVSASCPVKALGIKLSETKAGPGDIVTVAMYLDSRGYGVPGPFDIPVTLRAEPSGDGAVSEYDIHVVGELVPERRAIGAKELAKAPVCVAAPPVVDLGIIADTPVQAEFTVLNDGKSPLAISNVWSMNPALKIVSFPDKLKPGRQGKVAVTLDPAALRRGPFRIDVKVASDDPVNPLTILSVTGETAP